MSFQHVDMESAMRRLADRRIEEAMREGKFDNLRGMGKPLDLEPMPADENARMTWWALRLMKQNDFTPEEIRWRKQIDTLKEELASATTERRVIALATQINRLVYQLNTLGTNALSSPIAPVSLQAELCRLHERLASASAANPEDAAVPATPTSIAPSVLAAAIRHCGNATCKSRNPAAARFCRRCGSVLIPAT